MLSEGEAFRRLLPLEVQDEAVRDELRRCGMEPTYRNAICLVILQKAAGGDMTACRYVRDLALLPLGSERSVAAMDLSGCTDEELERLADGCGDSP